MAGRGQAAHPEERLGTARRAALLGLGGVATVAAPAPGPAVVGAGHVRAHPGHRRVQALQLRMVGLLVGALRDQAQPEGLAVVREVVVHQQGHDGHRGLISRRHLTAQQAPPANAVRAAPVASPQAALQHPLNAVADAGTRRPLCPRRKSLVLVLVPVLVLVLVPRPPRCQPAQG